MSDLFSSELSADGQTIEERREEARRQIAMQLINYFIIVLVTTLILIFILIYATKLEFDDALTLILAISSTFSGLLGSAITFYFSSNN